MWKRVSASGRLWIFTPSCDCMSLRIFPRCIETGRNPNTQPVGSSNPAASFSMSRECGGQRSQRVGLAIDIARRRGVQRFIRSPVPEIVGRFREQTDYSRSSTLRYAAQSWHRRASWLVANWAITAFGVIRTAHVPVAACLCKNSNPL